MNRQLMLMVLVNVALGLLFIFGNAFVWMVSNGCIVFSNLLWIQATSPDNMLGFVMVPNYPFVFFWFSTIVNLYFITKLQRGKETEQTIT